MSNTTGQAVKQLELKKAYGNFVNGQFVPSQTGETFTNLTPITGKPLCEVQRSRTADVERALDAAHAAAPRWGKTPPAERANILGRIADRIESNLERLALVETLDNGKPIRESRAADLPLAIDHFRYFAGCLRAEEGALSEIDDDTVAYHFREPLGVVGQIIPWNFPLLMATWKLAPALAAGNAVVLKPAEQTPLSIMVLMELIGDLLPPGVLNVVNGFGVEAGKPLASSPRVAKVAFTGETTTGRLILQYASENLIPVTLELGGKSPNIFFADVMRDDDDFLDKALEGLRHVRAQPGRGLHLPVARAGARVDLRALHGASGQAHRSRQDAGQSARAVDDDRRAGVERSAREDPELHRHRQEGGRQGPHRRRAPDACGRARRRLLRQAHHLRRAQQACASSRRRSSDRWCR